MNFVEYGLNFTCEEKMCIFHSWLRAVQPQKIEISDITVTQVMLLDSILPHPISSGNKCDKRSLNIAAPFLSFYSDLSHLFPKLF